MSEEFQVIDTTQIQLDSLVSVMDSIGYRLDRRGGVEDTRKPTGGFVTDNVNMKGNRNISTTTAVKIHNAPRSQWVQVMPGWYQLQVGGMVIAVSAYALNILFARKLVEKVKFQKNRKSPFHVVVTDHMIKPVEKEYAVLFGLTV